ncbi:hypothetical protein KAF25_003855 [Fusarium avenaceum]|uniref:F-box domain-containing protein n=1 Tax=Fusarium avenaceum TaxID=40199 RepID=A0A9P7GW72_9HYPO|nr:hypothetical protein KAF25_003855 [Fusarium avenaceum]
MSAPRRSTRIRNIDRGVTAETDKPAVVPATAGASKKRKVSDEDVQEVTEPKRKIAAKTKKVSEKGKGKTKAEANAKDAAAEPSVGNAVRQHDQVPNDALLVLPAEILETILENVNHPPSMVKLACTSKRHYSIVMPVLHKRISVSIGFWQHIPHLIRQIEPHLSIAQKKQLKREGKYKGQQEKFSTLLDPLAVPPCADYVRQVVIGGIDPGKKHKPVVMRYVEEVLKNVSNLEVIDACELTKSMSESIAAKKNLKALRLCVVPGGSGDLMDQAAPLAKLGNLEHISVLNRSWGSLLAGKENILQSMLLNSLSTLKSLEVGTNVWYSDFLADWENQIKARKSDALKQAKDFTALKSLSLSGVAFSGEFCENVMPSLTRAIDFLQLRELSLKDLRQGRVTFFKYLEDLFRGADKGTVQLRKLSLDMAGDDDSQSYGTTEYQVEGIYRFIASFDTLTTLEFAEHNIYNSAVESNPETLRFTYRGSGSGSYRTPHVNAKTVQILMKNLFNLRTLEFAPDEDDLDAMSRALARGKNLETIIISSFPSETRRAEDPTPWITITNKLLTGLMDNAGSGDDFVWENFYKLNRMKTSWHECVIGSDLKRQRDLAYKPAKITQGDRTVMCQDLLGKPNNKQHYYKAFDDWVEHIARYKY